MSRPVLWYAALWTGLSLAACTSVRVPAVDPAEDPLLGLADEVLALIVEVDPLVGYNIETADRHDQWPDISPSAMADRQAREDSILARLDALPPTARSGRREILHAQLRETIAARIARRVCRAELWSLSHYGGGAHTKVTEIAPLQPVETAALRAQAVERWRGIAAYIRQDIENLERGLALGYSAARTVARRAADQAEGFLTLDEEASPLYDPVRRADDPPFADALGAVIRSEIRPALEAYVAFIRGTYLAAAREDRALAANPDGVACWQALYRGYTTLERTAADVFAIGSAAVARSEAEVVTIGRGVYGTDDVAEIVRRAGKDPAQALESAEEMQQLFAATVARAKDAMPRAFVRVPDQPLVVEPYPDNVAGTGVAASYNRTTPDRPAVFRFDPSTWRRETRASARRTAHHEGYPGHHLQIAWTNQLAVLHPIERALYNSAYAEGWARYAEALAEELGLATTPAERILRRTWPARGMVVDAGLHVLGWSPQQVVDFVKASGSFDDEKAWDLVDRIAAIPAQLTAYDSGALEIVALRQQAEQALGEAFDLRQFHAQVLGDGMIPMGLLRQRVEGWVDGHAVARKQP